METSGRFVLHHNNENFQVNSRGVEWSLKNDGSRQILHESRNLGVTN